jgi:hypothetical protein
MYAFGKGCEIDDTVIVEAVKGGSMGCVQFVWENLKEKYCKELRKREFCSGSPARGHFKCFKYMENNYGIVCDQVVSNIGRYGHLDCLKYLHSNGLMTDWERLLVVTLAQNGHLNCLKWAMKNGYCWKEQASFYAGYCGHIHLLKYAVKKGFSIALACFGAAQGGHLDCLIYCHEQGALFDSNDVGTPICNYAASEGHLDCLKYAHENGCKWDYTTCDEAIRNRHLDCLKYAVENGCEIGNGWKEAAYEFPDIYNYVVSRLKDN